MKPQSGMFLVEVLVAMTIFAVAVMSLLSSMQWQLSALESLQQDMLALWVADNQLIKTHSVLSSIENGQTYMLGIPFTWRLTGATIPASSISMNQITVTSHRAKTMTLYAWFTEPEKKEVIDDQ